MLMIVKIVLVLLSIPLAVIGYKKKNKVLATLSFFLNRGFFWLSAQSKRCEGWRKNS
jgi:hypothetical protein